MPVFKWALKGELTLVCSYWKHHNTFNYEKHLKLFLDLLETVTEIIYIYMKY